MRERVTHDAGGSGRPGTGVGVYGITLAAGIDEPATAAAVGAVMAVARDLGGHLVALDLPLRALLVVPYPARRDTRLAISGGIRGGASAIVAGALSATVARRPGLLMVDLREATGIDDATAVRFGAAAERMGVWGGVLALWRPTDRVRRDLGRCGLDDLLSPIDAAPVLIA